MQRFRTDYPKKGCIWTDTFSRNFAEGATGLFKLTSKIDASTVPIQKLPTRSVKIETGVVRHRRAQDVIAIVRSRSAATATTTAAMSTCKAGLLHQGAST